MGIIDISRVPVGNGSICPTPVIAQMEGRHVDLMFGAQDGCTTFARKDGKPRTPPTEGETT